MTWRHILKGFSCLVLCGAAAHGQIVTYTFNPDIVIPDNSAVGTSDTESIPINSLIASVTVDLLIAPTDAGTFNGDYYVYLQHGSVENSVLLNRLGRSSTSGNGSLGYGDSGGINITLSDSAPNGDLHTYRITTGTLGSTPLTGIWAPDGRSADPSAVVTSDPRTAYLSNFNGQSAAGDWTLFIADTSPGGTGKLVSWSLNITPVPEPYEYGLISALSLVAFAMFRRCSLWR